MEQFSEQFKTALENIAGQLYNATLKECKRAIKAEGMDYQSGFEEGIRTGKNKVLENFPCWKIAPKDDYTRETVLALAGEFGYRIVYRGYAKDRKTMSFKYGGCRVGAGQKKWGAEPGKEYYVIKLGERI